MDPIKANNLSFHATSDLLKNISAYILVNFHEFGMVMLICSKGDALTIVEIRQLLTSYVKDNELISATDKRYNYQFILFYVILFYHFSN